MHFLYTFFLIFFPFFTGGKKVKRIFSHINGAYAVCANLAYTHSQHCYAKPFSDQEKPTRGFGNYSREK